MEKRQLGKTKKKVSILTLGGFGVGYISKDEAAEAIEYALNHGINMIDVAPTYGKAEQNLHKTIQEKRNKLFIAEKTQKRTKKEAWEELLESLERLGTDYFDLYQFHAVDTIKELDIIMGPDGALEAFLEAKDQGLIKNIGLTGHSDVQVHLEALKRFDFDTLLLPITIGAILHPHPVNDFRPVLKEAKRKNVGIIAIKVVAKGRWEGKKKYNTWYEPLVEQEAINDAIRFALSQEGVTTYSMAGDTVLWKKIIHAAENFEKISEAEKEAILKKAKQSDLQPLFPEK
ncbi:MAG: aldo/keto reductase [Asgard group archaeon]|nr:aldo/keto reductase [Asgard group archaeon]